MASSNKVIAKNTIFLSIRMIFVMFISLYTSRVFLRVLGVEDFGINNVVCGFVAMFSFLNTSLANGIQRFYNSENSINKDEGVTTVYNSALLIQFVLAVGVGFLLETFGLWYLFNKMVIPVARFTTALWIFQFSVFSAIIVIMQTPFSAAVLAYEKMNYYAVVGIVDVLLKLALAILLPYATGDRLWLYGLGILIISIISYILYFVYCKVSFPALHLKRCLKKGLLKKMVTFSGWNLFGTFACMMREQGLNMVLNLFFGPVVNAARGIAYQVSSALQGFVQTISVAAKPQMISSYTSGDQNRTIGLMYMMSKLSFVILFLLAIPICLEIKYILYIWLGDVIPEHTASFVILVILTNFVNNLNAPLSNVVYATGNMRNYQVTFSVINLLIIPISFFSLKIGCRPESVFVVYFIMSVFVQLGCLLVIKQFVDISLRDYCRTLIFPLLFVAIISFPLPLLVHCIMPEGILRLCAVGVVTCLTTVISFYIFAMSKNEKTIINNLVRNKLK